MTHRIRPALKRTLARILAVLRPVTGAERPRVGGPRTASGRQLRARATAPPHLPATSRSRTAPLDDAPAIDRAAGPLVRPYLVAYEQEERRTALTLALDGVDVGPWIIHGHPVGNPVMGVAA